MKKLISLATVLICLGAIINSCKKNYSVEQYTPVTTSSKPDLSIKVTTSVYGFITDENDKAVNSAMVTGGTQTTTTDQYGYFKISNVSLSANAAFVKVAMGGYFNGYKTFIAKEGKETFIRLRLIPKTAVGAVSATAGGTATTIDGASVLLPANGVVTASNSATYTGNVHIAAHWINPSVDKELRLNMPGDLLGLDTAGYLKILKTYGMLAVELTDDGGNLLQVAKGKQATLSFPIPSALSASAPATIPLWSFDETNGLWKQEGNGAKTGSNYVGNVSHFSYWNCDIGNSPISLTVQLVDSALHPLANVYVTVIGDEFNSYNHGYTDSSGFIYGMVPANAALQLNLLNDCDTLINIKEFATTSNPVNLGTIVVNSSQHEISLSGQAVDCNNAPIVNGTVILFNGNGNLAVTIQNGSFSLNTLACDNLLGNAIAIDSSNNIQSAVQPLSLNIGANDLGILKACDLSTSVFLTISEDGGTSITSTKVLYGGSAVNYQTFTAIFYNFGTVQDTSGITLNIAGAATTGIHTFVQLDSAFITAVRDTKLGAFDLPSASPVNISEYGNVGEFISGTFTSVFHRYNHTIIEDHTIACSFRVRRTQ